MVFGKSGARLQKVSFLTRKLREKLFVAKKVCN